MAFYSSLFSICPHDRKRHGMFVATTGRLFQVFVLGLIDKRLTFDPNAEIARIRGRYVWLIPRNMDIPFLS
jgi:hypothetical protein